MNPKILSLLTVTFFFLFTITIYAQGVRKVTGTVTGDAQTALAGATVTETGTNMNLLPNAQREKLALFQAAPAWLRLARPFWIAHHRLRRMLAGHYRAQSFSFALYTHASPHHRVTRHVEKPSYRWVRSEASPRPVV